VRAVRVRRVLRQLRVDAHRAAGIVGVAADAVQQRRRVVVRLRGRLSCSGSSGGSSSAV
jgi:hypothetical protein